MKNIKHLYFRLLYIVYKNLYLIINKFSHLLFFYYYSLKIFNYLVFISDEFYYDYYHFRRILTKSFKLYKKLSILKHIFIIFFFFAGPVPLFLFLSFCFFFVKYLFKYSFMTIDFFFNIDDNDEESYYYHIKYYIMYFFGYIPYIIIEWYKFLFKSRWSRYFLNMFINYLKNKKDKIFKYFINKVDYFFLVYIPSKYENFESIDFHNIYVDFMVLFYKVKKIVFIIIPWQIKKIIYKIYRFFYKIIYRYIYVRIYKNIILRNYRIHILRRYLALKFLYLKIERIYSDVYYYLLYKYKHVKYYLIWLFKVYIWSYACYITVEAFFDLNYLNGKGYIRYSIYHLYYNFCYAIIYKWCEFLKLIFKRSYYLSCLNFYIKKLRNRKLNYMYVYSWNQYFNFIYQFFILWVLVFIKANFFIDFNFDFRLIEFGDKSQTWYNIKIYDVVQLFFVRAYASAPLRYKLSFYSIVYHMRFNWFFGNIWERIVSAICFFFWIRGWHLWVWYYDNFVGDERITRRLYLYFWMKIWYIKVWYYTFSIWIKLRMLRNWFYSVIKWVWGKLLMLKDLFYNTFLDK